MNEQAPSYTNTRMDDDEQKGTRDASASRVPGIFFLLQHDEWEGFDVWAAGDADISSPTVRFTLLFFTFLNSTNLFVTRLRV